jgi:hypothetical protein
MSVAVDVDLEQRVVELVEAQRPGISAVELTERGKPSSHRPESVGAAEVARWLHEHELATEHNGLLQPTSRAIELGTTLELG